MTRLYLALGLLALFVGLGLQAQTGVLNANIPFDFQVGNSLMPAGEYSIDCSGHLIALRASDGKHAAMALTMPVSRAKAPTTGVLEFHRYGDAYFFAGVWAPNSPDGGALPTTPREKELASRIGPPQKAVVAFNSK